MKRVSTRPSAARSAISSGSSEASPVPVREPSLSSAACRDCLKKGAASSHARSCSAPGVIRSTFVVDEDGKIALAQYAVKATGHVAKLRRDLGLAA